MVILFCFLPFAVSFWPLAVCRLPIALLANQSPSCSPFPRGRNILKQRKTLSTPHSPPHFLLLVGGGQEGIVSRMGFKPKAVTQFPHKVNEKKRDNDLSRQKNHFITKILCIFILKSDAMSIFFGYFADVNHTINNIPLVKQ